jgi:hypothetical protein
MTMMNIFERLKQLKKLLPSEDYTLRSRAFILATEQELAPLPKLTVWQFVVQNLQMGSAIALTALLLLFGLGGFSAWKFLSPFGLRSLDPSGLRAEADAIQDIQVALKTVQYTAPADTTPTLFGAPKPAGTTGPKQTAAVTSSSGSAAITGTPENATTTSTAAASSTSDDFSTTTVDAALDYLLQ